MKFTKLFLICILIIQITTGEENSEVICNGSTPYHSYFNQSECVDCKYKFKIEENKTCFDNLTCPSDYPKHDYYDSQVSDPLACRSNCSDNQINIYDDNDICYYKCPNERPFHNASNICIEECQPSLPKHDSGYYECKENCTNGKYEFNNVCYSKCPALTKESGEKCECIYNYYIINSTNTTVCLENSEPCPSDFPYLFNSSSECLAEKPDNCPYIRKTTSFPVNYKCVLDCDEFEYYYLTEENKNVSCVTQCPLNYYINGKYCSSNCEGKFLDESTKTCLDSCKSTGYYLYDGLGKTNGTCFSGSSCPSTYPYFYKPKTACLTNCSLLQTNSSFFELSEKDDYFLNEEKNECYTECPEGTFALKEQKLCVKDCKNYDKYSYNGTCFDNCTDANNSLNGVKEDLIELDDTHKCVFNNNSEYYYIYDENKSPEKYYKNGCPEKTNDGKYLYQNDLNKTCYTNPLNCPYQASESSKKCIQCEVPTSSELPNEGYYIFNSTITNDNFCYKKCPQYYPYFIENKCYNTTDDEIFNNKLKIDGTNEYVEKCPISYYEFNNVCYHGNCPTNTINYENTTICNCSYKYYFNEKNEIQCLGLNDPCPSPYNFTQNNQCKDTKCDIEYSYMRLVSTNPKNYECLTEKCDKSEYYYNTTDNITLCTDKCPSDFSYHDNEGENKKLCREKCDSSTHFTDETNKLCYEKCPDSGLNLLNTENGNETILAYGNCISGSTCPNDAKYFVEFNKTCISNCSLTQNYSFFGNNLITYLDVETKTCVENCPKKIDIEHNHNCVEKCDEKQFEINDTCYNSCNDAQQDLYYIYETHECVVNCSGYYYSDSTEKICYINCPSDYYYDDENKTCYKNGCPSDKFIEDGSNKKCISCNNINNETDNSTNKGYRYGNTCYKECPKKAPYYNYSDNVCSENECDGDFPIQKENSYECLNNDSCNGVIFNYICYSKCPDGMQVNYTDNHSCLCPDKYYLYDDSSKNKKIKCLNIGQPCPDGKQFYDPEEKLCTDTCENKRRITISSSITNYECIKNCSDEEFEYTQKENNKEIQYCTSKCPEKYPYHIDIDNKTCLENCPSNYYTDDQNKICYIDCPNYNTLDESKTGFTKSKCVDQCPSSYPYLYEDNKTCVSDCNIIYKQILSSGMPVYLDTTSNRCLNKCKYYYDYTTQKCVDKCGDKQFKNETGNVCYDSCPEVPNAKIIHDTQECLISKECPLDYPFTYNDNVTNDNKTECYKSCPYDSYQYDNKTCYSTCPNDKKFIDEEKKNCVTCEVGEGFYLAENNKSNICYNKCPDNAPYFKTGDNKCYEKGCPVSDEDKDFKILLDGTYQCIKECDESSYFFNNVCYNNSCPTGTDSNSTDNHTCHCLYKYFSKSDDIVECLGAGVLCPSKYKSVLPDGKCVTEECTTNYKRKISSSESYECTDSCYEGEFIYEDEKNITYCVNKCYDSKPFHKSNETECLTNCSFSDDDKGKYYTDELNHICYLDCPNPYLNTINNGTKDKCVSITECLAKNYYLYDDKYCLSSCEDSLNFEPINEKTVLDKDNNQCVSKCNNKTQFIDNSTENCVEECASNQYTSLSDRRCYDTCPTEENKPKYIIEDLKLCVINCGDKGYYSLNKNETNDTKCYKSCPSGNYIDEENKICYDGICPNNYFIKKSTNKCIKECKTPTDKDNIKTDEGYIYSNETNSTRLCLEKCTDERPYINKGENICYEKGNSYLKKYKIADTNEFDDKCESLTFNNICYNKCPENTEKKDNKCVCLGKYYNDTYNDTVCLNVNDPCPDNMPYIYNKKCVEMCPDGNNITKQINTAPINYQCLDECFDGEYLYENTCLQKCKEGSYHIFQKYTCLDNCTKEETKNDEIKYFSDNVNFICYEECPILGTIKRDENGLVNDTCTTDSTCPSGYYYYDVKKVCLPSCNDTRELYNTITKIDEENKKCINSCPKGKYYIFKNETCVDKCEYEYKFIYKNACYDNCTNATKKYYYLNETNECLTENEIKNYYNSTDPYIYYQTCPSGTFQDDDKKECKSNDDCTKDNKYIKNSNNKCVTCEIPKNYDSIGDYEGFINGTECIEKCPDGFEYYNYGNNTCYSENDTNLKQYKIENMNAYTDKCPQNYYLFNDFCYKNSCPLNTHLIDTKDNICNCSYNFVFHNDTKKYECFSSSKSCPNETKFYDEEYGCIEKCTEERPFIKKISSVRYECIKECSFDEYIYTINENEKYCYDECPENAKYHIFNDKNCLSSCNSTEYYTDEKEKVCRENCPYLKTLNDVNITYKGNCVSESQCSNDLILFEEGKLCLPNCSITENLTDGQKTYLHEGTTIKQCTTKCSSMLTKKITDEENNICVEECSSKQFSYNNSCYNNCSNISLDYYINETRECIVNCSGYYSIENSNENICYKSCPSNYYINETSKTCIENCSSGFIIKDDTKKICYSKCPEKLKNYNEGTNECIEKCVYPYQFENMETGECSTSNKCPENYYTFNYKCYQNCTKNTKEDINNTCSCLYKFYKSTDDNKNEILVCLDENINICPGDKTYTTYKNECVAECPEDTYQDDVAKMCYNSSENVSCKNDFYLKISTKKCIKSCENPSSKNNLASNEGYYIENQKGEKMCYDECPDNYTYNTGDNKCQLDGCKDEKYPYNILGTKECTNICPTGYFKFNNICYKDKCPENTEYDNDLGICKCLYKFEIISNETYKCLGKNVACPYGKRIFDTELGCISNCTGYRKQYSVSVNGTIDYLCDSNCNNYIYTNDDNETYCYSECPIDKKYHYYNETDCVKSCANFTDEENLICYNDNCPKYNIIDENDVNATTGECVNKCSGNKIYSLEDKTCLSNCKLTEQIPFLGNMTTYKTIEANNYKCVKNCSLNEIKKLTDTVQNECVEKCGENLNGGKYLYKEQCYNNCTLANENLTLYLDDTKECVLECPESYFKENTTNRCYKTCPEKNNKNEELFAKNSKFCVTCDIPNNISSITENEGFYVPSDSSKKCYEECPSSSPYYDFGDNKCFSGSCLSDNNVNKSMIYSLYSKDTKNYVCYSNCSDAVENWQYYLTENSQCVEGNSCPIEYKYEFIKNEQEKICYKDGCPDPLYKKEVDDNGITHCIKKCNETGSDYYSQGDFCVKECDNITYPYRIEPSSFNQTIGMCLTKPDECLSLNFYYYNTSDKVCSDSCTEKKIQTNPETGKPFTSSQGTCVTECPKEYPYEYDNTCYHTSCPEKAPFTNESEPFKCLETCGKNYESQGKYCISDCKNTTETKFWMTYGNDKKKCVNSCKENNKYYFANEDNECIDDCKKTNDDNSISYYYYNPDTNECAYNCSIFKTYKYFNEIANESLACLIKCPEGSYYYEEEKKCLEKCNDTDYHSSLNDYLCVKSCGINEKIIKDTSQCTAKCDDINKYLISLEIDENNTINYCHSKCDGSINETYKYILSSSKQCVQKCSKDENYLFEGTCYSECPAGNKYYTCNETEGFCECKKSCDSEEKKFFNEDGYECLNNCSDGYIYRLDDNTSYTCFSECPSDYSLRYEKNSEGYIICTNECNNETYQQGNKCVKECDSSYKLENITRKCYLECPSKYYSSVASDNKTEICIEQCDQDSLYKYYTSSYKECLTECPYDASFIGKNNECKKQCETTDGIYYYLIQRSSNDKYDIYTCLQNCKYNGFLEIYGKNECVNVNCTENSPYKSVNESICYSDCQNSKNYQYSLEENGDYTCVEKCPENKKYYDDDKNCIDSCSQLPLRKIKNYDNECVEKCNLSSSFKYEENSTCVEKCSSGKYYNLEQKYNCTSVCESPKNYILESGECSSSCNDFKNKTDTDEIKCLKKCESNYTKYYEDSKTCLPQCNDGDYEIQNSDICVKTCNGLTNTPYFYITNENSTIKANTCLDKCSSSDKIFVLNNKTCSDKCETDYPYYKNSDHICLISCPDGYKSHQTEFGYECLNDCPNGTFLYRSTSCINSCPSEVGDYRYYFESDRECLKNCGNNAFSIGQICLDKCNDTYPYALGTVCQEKCNGTSKYLVEINNIKYCKEDCTSDLPYINANDSAENIVCYAECPDDNNQYQQYYIKENNIARTCKLKCDGGYKFIGLDGKQCIKKCPSSKPYYEEAKEENIICYEKCPDGYYHDEEGDEAYICRKNCSNKNYPITYYDKKLCIEKCDSNKISFNKKEEGITYCLDTCNTTMGLYITPNEKCVSNCSDVSDEPYLKADLETHKCVCKNLYYLSESNGKEICIDPTIEDCSKNTNEFKIPYEGSAQCLKSCLTLLSMDNICLKELKCPENNTKIIQISSSKRICKCSYKFYISEEDYNTTKCLGANENCPKDYNLFITDTNECVKNCPTNYPYKYNDKYCVNECPENTNINSTTKSCDCIKYWIKENEEVTCLSKNSECPNSYPLLIEATNECVQKCTTDYKIIYNKKCLDKCEDNTKEVEIDEKDSLKKYSDYTCKCKNLWYYITADKMKINCTNIEYINTENRCSELSKDNIYLIYNKNQCAESCPDGYYKFNHDCYTSCDNPENTNFTSKLTAKSASSNECICREYSYKKDDFTTCLNNELCPEGYLLIDELDECLQATTCPKEYKRLFNYKCYKNCPDNTYYDANLDETNCLCENLWYNDTNSNNQIIKKCLEKTITQCSLYKTYLIQSTKECVNTIDEKYYLYNFVLYEKCPEGTLPNEDGIKKCVCDPSYGIWYNDTYNNLLYCKLSSCPSAKPYLLYDTKECVLKCSDGDGTYFSFEYTCYKGGCPDKYEKDEQTQTCSLKSLENSKNIKEYVNSIKEDITHYINKSKLEFNSSRFGVDVDVQELYQDSKKNKDINFDNDLTYIDFGKCWDQIQEKYGYKLQGKNPILIKADITGNVNSNDYGSVQYELYSPDGERLVISCNEITISYPITRLKNKYKLRNLQETTNEINNFEYLYNFAKKVYEKYNDIDTFHSSNKFYHDICVSCELDGKDLVLKDRPNYFPNNMILCENTECKHNKTNFEEDRIECTCSFNSGGIQGSSNSNSTSINYDIVSQDEADSNQNGPSNFPVLKCIDDFKVKKNGLFVFSIILLILEFILGICAFTLGVSFLVEKINNKIRTNTEKNNNKNNDNYANPPRKNAESSEDNEEEQNYNKFDIKVNMPELKITDKNNEEYAFGRGIELIPREYSHFFFAIKDSGVTKEINRAQLPFKISEDTKYLLEPIPGATYGDKFNNPTSFKQNILIVKDEDKKIDINDINIKVNLDLGKKTKKENINTNVNTKIKSKKVFKKIPSAQYGDDSKEKSIDNSSENKDSEEEIKVKKRNKKFDVNEDDSEIVEGKKNKLYGKKKVENEENDDISNVRINKKNESRFNDYTENRNNNDSRNIKVNIEKESFSYSDEYNEKANVYGEESLCFLMRREKRYKEYEFDKAVSKDKENYCVYLITFICDKIYLFDIILFRKEYDIFTALMTLYLFYHLCLISLITAFFDIPTLSKIFFRDGYPNFGQYLLFGLYSMLIAWVVYRLLMCLIRNNNKLIGNIHKNTCDMKAEYDAKEKINIKRNIDSLICRIKVKLVVFYLIVIGFSLLFFFYLSLFGSIYTGTKQKIFIAYGITLVEILVIKIVYAIILSALRKVAISSESACLYIFVKFMDLFLS